ncbi:MAG: hypothetical protein H7095_09680 [Pseudopedobacter sp.]|nr:hypothetical protein [Deinococcales bacterium]
MLGNLKDAQRIALELNRIKGDLEAARTRWIWFQEVGHLALALRAVRYFPALEAPTLEKTLSQPANQNSQHSQPLARLKVLGPIQLEREGQSVHYRGHKRTELLAYLLERRIAGHQGADSLELLDTLYPDVSEDEGKRTLKQQIYLIRGNLGRSSILSTPGGYALGAVSSDAEEFLAGGESALWRGPYLEGLGNGWIGGVKDALFLALKTQLESPLERQKAPCLSLARSLCGMEPYDLNALKVALRALLKGAGTPAAHTFYLERRTLFVEVGEELPVSFEEFLEFIPLQP